MIYAHHIHPAQTGHQCQRCGIQINECRVRRYGESCRDCAEYLGATRKAA
jgi:hypothetical protein